MTRQNFRRLAAGAALAALLAGCSNDAPLASTGTPAAAPAKPAPASPEQLLAGMSLENKVAQIIMPDIGDALPRKEHLPFARSAAQKHGSELVLAGIL